MTDFRALCIELTDCLEKADWPLRYRYVFRQWVDIARAALADEPAVPDGREPASVTEQPSDENCWQWYTYCPEEGLDMYSDRKQAQSAAQSIMGSYEVAAHSDGWHEDMELVSWGMLVPVEQAQVVERKTAEPDDEFDEWVKYELRPVRWGNPAPPPADGEVAELVKELRRICFDVAPCDDDIITRAADLLERLAPQPPSLAEQALGALEQIDGWAVSNMNHLSIHDDLVTGVEAIRTALERLQELEGTNG